MDTINNSSNNANNSVNNVNNSNINNYYTSNNDSFTMTVSNVQIAVMLTFQTISLLGIINLLLFVPLKSRLLGQSNPSAHMSSMMRLFLGSHAILLLTNMAVYLQKATGFFNPYTQFYVVIWIYDIGAPYNYIQSCLNFILTLERILVIRFPLYAKRYHSHYLCAAALFIPCVYMSLLIWYILEMGMPLDQAKALCCAPLIYNSLFFNYFPQTMLKLFYGFIDLGCGIFFIVWLNKNMGKKIKNRVIKFTVVGEIVFEIVPGFLYWLGNNFKLIPPTASLMTGNLKDTMVGMNLTMCVLYYNWIFLIVAPRTRGDNLSSNTRVIPIQQPSKSIFVSSTNIAGISSTNQLQSSWGVQRN